MSDSTHADVLVVGAGMAGLAAASTLQAAGRSVIVLDKGRGVGGRMSTRRIGDARLDHGAQFFTARSEAFAACAERWCDAGAAHPWHRAADDAPVRHRGDPGMTAVPKHMARDLDVRLDVHLTEVAPTDGGWRATARDDRTWTGAAALLTPPVPQALALLGGGGAALPESARTALAAITYEPCLALLAVLDGPSDLEPPGVVEPAAGPIAWLADNHVKGVSPVPAVTAHASPEFSLEHVDGDRERAAEILLTALRPHVGAGYREHQLHAWRYSRPVDVHDAPCLALADPAPLAFAGDGFGGPRVEGAFLSGVAAAEALLS